MDDFCIGILDDDTKLLKTFSDILLRMNFRVFAFSSPEKFRENIKRQPLDLLFLDINLGEENGLDILAWTKTRKPDLRTVIISGEADILTAVKALKSGADDFLEKPIHLKDIKRVLASPLSLKKAGQERDSLLGDVLARYEMIGSSPAITALKEKIVQYAPLNQPVLITGESGTGKELAAAQLHYLSPRCGNSFFRLNMACLPEHLVESRLFGHKKGAFTGADSDSPGLFRAAHDSTLFLDEIGEMDLQHQSKLLRTLQEKEILPLGAMEPVPVQVRTVFATNRNLERDVAEGRFREDLLYRLNTLILTIPPLRERREDIPALVGHFSREFFMENNLPEKNFSDSALDFLIHKEYPGNIRELKSQVIRSILEAGGSSEIKADHFSGEPRSGNSGGYTIFEETKSLNEKKKEMERVYIKTQIEKYNGDLKATAGALGILVNNLYRKIKELGIE